MPPRGMLNANSEPSLALCQRVRRPASRASNRTLAIAASGTSLADLASDCRFAAVDAVLDRAELPWDEHAFAALQGEVRKRGGPIAAATLASAKPRNNWRRKPPILSVIQFPP